MTIKAIKEKYKDYKIKGNEKNMFAIYDYQDGKELLKDGDCRPCDNLDDAIYIAGEMIAEG